MNYSRVAFRYATAFFEAAQQENLLSVVARDLQVLKSSIAEFKNFALYLRNPIIKSSAKKERITSLFQSECSPSTMRFLTLVVEKKREGELEGIISAFEKIYNEFIGIQHVTIVSAVELNAEQKSGILSKVASYTGKKIEATYQIDKSLIGGFVVNIDSTVLDASVKHQLEQLKKQLASGMVYRN